jgi:nucleotide-binding universal stress UspA family protein
MGVARPEDDHIKGRDFFRTAGVKLVVPIDQSYRDAVIIPYAAGISIPLRASLAVAHIVPGLSLLPRTVREAEAYADVVAQQLRDTGLDAESFVGRGDPAELILQLVNDLPADMVIMATRGRRGMSKIMLGSVADAILRLCPVPLLLVNADNAVAAQANGTAANGAAQESPSRAA